MRPNDITEGRVSSRPPLSPRGRDTTTGFGGHAGASVRPPDREDVRPRPPLRGGQGGEKEMLQGGEAGGPRPAVLLRRHGVLHGGALELVKPEVVQVVPLSVEERQHRGIAYGPPWGERLLAGWSPPLGVGPKFLKHRPVQHLRRAAEPMPGDLRLRQRRRGACVGVQDAHVWTPLTSKDCSHASKQSETAGMQFSHGVTKIWPFR